MFRAGIIAAAAMLLIAAGPIPSPNPADHGRPPVADHSEQVGDQASVNQNGAKPVPGADTRTPLYVQTKCEHGCGYAEDVRSWLQKLWADPVATFTAVLAIFTVFLSIATIRAANAAKAAADALPALERAYIFIARETSIDIQDVLRGGHPHISIGQYLNNVGRTPAIIKFAKTAIAVCATPEEIEPQARDANRTEWIISQNTTGVPGPEDYDRNFTAVLHWAEWEKRISAKTSDEPNYASCLTREERLGIQSGEMFLWVWCKIIYDDVFGVDHVTTYLLRANAKSLVPEPYGGDRWNYRT